MKYLISSLFLTFCFYSIGQDCSSGGEALIDLHVNNIKAKLRIAGDLWWNGENGTPGQYITNSGEGEEVSPIFAGALWIGGKDSNNEIKLAAQMYRKGANTDYYPGPLDQSGQPYENGCTNWDRFWVVNKEEVGSHRIDFSDGEIDTPIDHIYSWPGKNNPHFESYVGFAIPNNQDLAPFHDRDQDGIYNPDKGDYPLIKGDQSIWWVFNDNAGIHGLSNATPIQIEVHGMAYAFNSENNEDLNNSTFYDFELINKGNEEFKDAFVGMWTDFSLGCPSEETLTGYNMEHQMMFAYNEDDFDGNEGEEQCAFGGEYGYEIPMVGIKKIYNDDYSVTSYSIMHTGLSCDPPFATFYPQQSTEYYNSLSGLWVNGTPFIYGNQGYDPNNIDSTNTTKFLYPGDPSDDSSWSMCTNYIDCHHTSLMSSPIPDLQHGQSTTVSYAVIFVEDVPHPCPSLDRLKEAADNVCNAILSSTTEITQKADIAITPNPAIGTINITSSSIINTIKVYGLDGQLMKNETNVNLTSMVVDISSLASNMYLLSVQDSDGNVSVERFVKN